MKNGISNKEIKRSLDPVLENKIKNFTKNNEENSLSEFASKSNEAIRKRALRHDIREEYSRDTDRIINTHAYSRYIDKTQVFFLVENDHVTHRVLHVQLVSKIARTIGRALKLNEDLIEAISLGHDIGHVPYGHLGEKYLSKLCREHNIKGFYHNAQSVQFLDYIEDCNLTIQVLDGILSHNGEIHNQRIKPNREKDWDTLLAELDGIKDGKIFPPMTLEGCVVRVSDRIAYLGRDIQDSIEIGLIKDASDVPDICKEIVGTSNGEIINNLVIDLVENSYDCDSISYSAEVSRALDKYNDFNMENIYKNPKLLKESSTIEKMYTVLFKTFLNDLIINDRGSKIFDDLINLPWISKRYLRDSNFQEKVRDYIAGMTDRYFENVFSEYFTLIPMPKRVKTFREDQN